MKQHTKNNYLKKEIKYDWEEIQKLQERLFRLRFGASFTHWTVNDIINVCQKLKNNKARDECGLVYDLFKYLIAGRDIFLSLTTLLNGIKK